MSKSGGSELYLGVLSGTSIDGLSLAVVDFAPPGLRLVATREEPFAPPLRRELLELCRVDAAAGDVVERLGVADRQLALAIAAAVKSLLGESGIAPGQLRAIGSHGQTIRHRPPQPQRTEPSFSLQLGDPNTIAHLSGITTVADFRRRDLAAGGQGAPLATLFHREFFTSPTEPRAIVNIGGISNLSLLPPPPGSVLGFDLGPGNVLMDAWILEHKGAAYDRDGAWASQGRCHPQLLKRLEEHDFFRQKAPKSTGREDFHLPWLQQCLDTLARQPPPEDVQRTLLELTARAIAQGVAQRLSSGEVFLCGGGAHNTLLRERLGALLAPLPVDSSAALGVAPVWVEAAAFAWLARQSLARQPSRLKEITGARRDCVLGGVYLG